MFDHRNRQRTEGASQDSQVAAIRTSQEPAKHSGQQAEGVYAKGEPSRRATRLRLSRSLSAGGRYMHIA
jgi:hypothetical protein